MDPVQTLNFPDGAVLSVYYDELTESPRESDCNLGHMVCFHRRYILGDKHDYRSADFGNWDAVQSQIEKDNNVALILPVYMYDHSGITINTTGFHCPWDSGQVGFIFVTKEAIRYTWSCKRITKKLLEKARQELLGEIEFYDQFLRGDVYYFTLEDGKGEIIESRGGFYGRDINENGILDSLPDEYQKLALDLCAV